MVTAMKNSLLADCIAMVVVLLMAVGTVFVFSASANLGQEINLQRFYHFPGLRQILFFPIACLIMYTVSCVDYRRFSGDGCGSPPGRFW